MAHLLKYGHSIGCLSTVQLKVGALFLIVDHKPVLNWSI